MMDAVSLYNSLIENGFRLSPEGDSIRITPFTRLTAEMKSGIVEHKQALLTLLISRRELEREIEAISRRDFAPDGFPPLLARCINHFVLGPVVSPAEGMAAWWAGARRQVMGMIERIRQQPGKGKPP
jgi:hypothetical protein